MAWNDQMFFDAMRELRLFQRGFGELIGVSERTIQRWSAAGIAGFTPSQCVTVARALYPTNRALAAEYAARGGATLLSLGLESPPPTPAAAVVGPVAGAAAPALPKAALPVIADGLLYAFGQSTGRDREVLRAALDQILRRAVALGLSLDGLVHVLANATPSPAERLP